MTLGQNAAKKHPKERTSENAREYDQADCDVIHGVTSRAGIPTKWGTLLISFCIFCLGRFKAFDEGSRPCLGMPGSPSRMRCIGPIRALIGSCLGGAHKVRTPVGYHAVRT